MYWKNLVLLHWKYLFSVTLKNIILCCFSVGSPILFTSAWSAQSTLQILKLINSSEILKVILKLLFWPYLSAGCMNDGFANFHLFWDMKINLFLNVLLYFYVKKLRLVLNSKNTARTLPANRQELNSKKKLLWDLEIH